MSPKTEVQTVKKIAIITGASAGLGTEYARMAANEYASMLGLNEIWLIARRRLQLEKIAQEFQGVKGICLDLNLANPEDLAVLERKIAEEKPNIRLLVNNAGFGKIGAFSLLPLTVQLEEIEVNIRALTAITHMSIPYMHTGSAILQVGSSIGFAPAPKRAVYAATKAYVLSFSLALRQELKKNGIAVCTVCPGPVATEFLEVAMSHVSETNPGKPIASPRLAASAKSVVEKSYHDAFRGKAISVYGLWVQCYVCLASILPPSWMARILTLRGL